MIHGINGSPLKTWRTLHDKKKDKNYTLWPKVRSLVFNLINGRNG